MPVRWQVWILHSHPLSSCPRRKDADNRQGGCPSLPRPTDAWTGSGKSLLSLSSWQQLIHYKHDFQLFSPRVVRTQTLQLSTTGAGDYIPTFLNCRCFQFVLIFHAHQHLHGWQFHLLLTWCQETQPTYWSQPQFGLCRVSSVLQNCLQKYLQGIDGVARHFQLQQRAGISPLLHSLIQLEAMKASSLSDMMKKLSMKDCIPRVWTGVIWANELCGGGLLYSLQWCIVIASKMLVAQISMTRPNLFTPKVAFQVSPKTNTQILLSGDVFPSKVVQIKFLFSTRTFRTSPEIWKWGLQSRIWYMMAYWFCCGCGWSTIIL